MEEFRRELRKFPTRFETLLWERLRSSQLEGRKFRRQHSVGIYILDFYCPAEKLCIEIDGYVHCNTDAIIHDTERDHALSQLMIKTLRFANAEIETDIEEVLRRIREQFKD
ncbi:endonuclease domain-containing protein [Spirosoma endophyticum]|uniref:Very-short-patch-repair endonuclease n=1 Tax=Spirosoma endophyticum TaxID=662367 RepID=A0A1I1WRS2_9BACT|nr:endonuclease domain-containing protein [Spirosoma endophyticum]SFD97742.1 Very-short-patch-repair endonuclease [Spirosoma endophyticum]